nr:unnamed protein product [Digitaria exilis]
MGVTTHVAEEEGAAIDTPLLHLVALRLLLLPLAAVQKGKNGGRLPPGPLAVPLLGNWQRYSVAHLVARYGPVVSLRVGTRLVVLVADRRVAHAALVETGAELADRPAATRTRPFHGEIGNTTTTVSRARYGPTWRLLRRNQGRIWAWGYRLPQPSVTTHIDAACESNSASSVSPPDASTSSLSVSVLSRRRRHLGPPLLSLKFGCPGPRPRLSGSLRAGAAALRQARSAGAASGGSLAREIAESETRSRPFGSTQDAGGKEAMAGRAADAQEANELIASNRTTKVALGVEICQLRHWPQPRRRDAPPAVAACPAALRPCAPRARRQAPPSVGIGVQDEGPAALRERDGGAPARRVLPPPPERAAAAAQRNWIMFMAYQAYVFAFSPAVTKRLFRRRLQMGLDARRRQKELFMALIDARRERKKLTPKKKDTSSFEHAYVDTLFDIKLPNEEGGSRRLTDDELVSLCSEFLAAGTDTTSTALEWIMAELVKNPTIQGKLYSDIKETFSEEVTRRMRPYLKAVVLEGLRRHTPTTTPISHSSRFQTPYRTWFWETIRTHNLTFAHIPLYHYTIASHDVDVCGYLIPKGRMGRDETEWERPMEFSPERFLPDDNSEGVDVTGSKGIRMMPFGAGRRICAGLGVAMMHLEYFVANLMREFEWHEVPGDEVDMAERHEITTVMKKPASCLVPRRMIPRGLGPAPWCTCTWRPGTAISPEMWYRVTFLRSPSCGMHGSVWR